MDKPRPPLLPVILSVLACLLAGAALLRGGGAPVVASSVPDPSALQLRELSGELADLKAELARVASARPETASRESAAPQTELPPELEQRIAALEKQAKERAAKVPSGTGATPDPRKAQLVATDPRASEQEKLDALHALRGQKVDGQDALTHDVIQALLDMSERSQDESTREDVYRNLHGLKDFSLRDSMLRALASDPSAKVRTKVAQDIDTFLPDPQVEAALKQAAQYDADAGVRVRAAATLAGKR